MYFIYEAPSILQGVISYKEVGFRQTLQKNSLYIYTKYFLKMIDGFLLMLTYMCLYIYICSLTGAGRPIGSKNFFILDFEEI